MLTARTSRSLDGDEVQAEMTRIGLTSAQATQILQYHKNATGHAELGVDDLINALMHVLGNSIPALSASDMVTIGHLFTEFDENGDGSLDLTEFRQLALELVHTSYTFTGRETLDSLDLVQLDVLRKHKWKRREAQELKDGEEANNAQNAMNAKKQTFDAEATDKPKSPADEEEDKPMYQDTKAQKKKLEAICLAMQSVCKRLLAANREFCEQAQALMDEDGQVSPDIVAFSLELKSELQKQLLVDVDTDASGRVSFQEFCAMFGGQGADRSELRVTFDRLDVNKEGTLSHSELSMYMLDAKLPPDNGGSGTISRGASIKRMPSRRRRADMDALRDAKEVYGALVEVESLETMLREICLEQVIDIAFKLQKEGVVAAPPLVCYVVPGGGATRF
jgi:Ca2+-binding EF-hand superfamily protein